MSKKAASDTRRRLVERIGVGTYATGTRNFELLDSMLQGHYNYKDRGTIVALQIQRDPRGGFLRIFTHGAVVDSISYTNTLHYGAIDYARIKKEKIDKAMRIAIQDDVQAFRSKHYCSACPECSARNTIFHVDHFPISFVTIKDTFLADNPDHPELIRGDIEHFDSSDPWTRKWQEAHREAAQFRFLCASCNCRLGAHDRR